MVLTPTAVQVAATAPVLIHLQQDIIHPVAHIRHLNIHRPMFPPVVIPGILIRPVTYQLAVIEHRTPLTIPHRRTAKIIHPARPGIRTARSSAAVKPGTTS